MDIFYPWRLLARRLALLFAFYFAFRLFFASANWSAFVAEPWGEILFAFFNGLRFDAWALLWSLLPMVMMTLLPFRWQARPLSQKLIFGYVAVVHLVAISLNFIDVELFKFTGRRLSMDWLRLQKDVEEQSTSLIGYYWWLLAMGLVAWAMLWWLWPRWRTPVDRARAPALRWALAVPILGLFALGLRGGLGHKPLSLTDAYARGSAPIGVLTLNSTFSFFKNRLHIDSVGTRFLADRNRASDLVSELAAPFSERQGQLKGWNVVVIMVESLASEYVGALNDGLGYTPFLDELAKKSWVFDHNFANGRRSIEAVPSVVCGLPSLMSEAFILSPFQGVELHCLGEIARQAGYATHFFHGAYNGSMHFDSFANRAGFAHFYGYDEYPHPEESDGSWGVYDEPFLQFAAQTMDQSPKPFAATIFTLSSHYPYRLPPAHQNRYPKGKLEIHESIGYTDQALREFFAAVETKSWFKNTIFFITGDHTHKSVNPKYQTFMGYYRVPLIVYAPGLDWSVATSRITQHADILPTIVDLLGFKAERRLKFGQSIFAPGPGVWFNGDNWGYWLLTDKWIVQYPLAQGRFLFAPYNGDGDLVDKPKEPTEPLSVDAKKAMAWLQGVVDYFNIGITDNALYRF